MRRPTTCPWLTLSLFVYIFLRRRIYVIVGYSSFISTVARLLRDVEVLNVVPSESARARPGSAKGCMRNNCCVIAVINTPARLRFVFSYVNTFIQWECIYSTVVCPLWNIPWKVKSTCITRIHLRNSNKLSYTKFEPFRRTDCGELLDISSGDVQPAR